MDAGSSGFFIGTVGNPWGSGWTACVCRLHGRQKKEAAVRPCTIRRIPDRLDERIRALAAREGKSMNAAPLDLLRRAAGLSGEAVEEADLDGLAGARVQDKACEAVLAARRKTGRGRAPGFSTGCWTGSAPSIRRCGGGPLYFTASRMARM
jgi:plasmid stability protein